jgi:hypothetical protein
MMDPELMQFFRRIAEQMRETCARVVELMADRTPEDIAAQIRALPLPGDEK